MNAFHSPFSCDLRANSLKRQHTNFFSCIKQNLKNNWLSLPNFRAFRNNFTWLLKWWFTWVQRRKKPMFSQVKAGQLGMYSLSSKLCFSLIEKANPVKTVILLQFKIKGNSRSYHFLSKEKKNEKIGCSERDPINYTNCSQRPSMGSPQYIKSQINKQK